MPKISRTKQMVELPTGFVPGPGFVICAKGKQAKQNKGNQLLRSLVESNLEEYSKCRSKLDRSFIVSKIIRIIREDGGFVRSLNGRWYDVSDRNAREKIGQMFRDSLSDMFKSSTRAKANIRRMRAVSTIHSSSCSSDSSSTSVTSTSTKSQQSTLNQGSDRIMQVSPVPSFPITEVRFVPELVTPDTLVKSEIKMNVIDFEPLPLSQVRTLDLNMSGLPFEGDEDDCLFSQTLFEILQF